MPSLSRRSLLALLGAGAAAAPSRAWAFNFLEPVEVENPLKAYPNRDWERVYRDLYAYDSTFTFLCAPNDTHNCLLTAYVRNGTMVRIGPSFGFGEATDLEGRKATHRWDPRCCQKGLALVRRFYGDRRVKYPMVRKGWYEWAKAGFPRGEDGKVDPKYLRRAREPFLRVTWTEVYDLIARGMEDVAKTYSGEEGSKKLLAQGYDPAMVEAMHHAGVQTIKVRGGMPALGATRIMALYRVANSLALLDQKVRGVSPEESVGSRYWDSYSWHTDLPPGHPMVTGQQTVEWDLALVEHANVVIAWGMNWISTKMPDSHWLTEARLKGTKVVVIACEYQSTMNKADYGLVVRPGTTPALALGFCHVILSEKLWDAAYVKAYTDLPALVRLDTMERLRADDVQGAAPPAGGLGAVVLKKGEKAPVAAKQKEMYIPEALLGQFGPYVVWDAKKGTPAGVARDEVGKRFRDRGVDPALTGTVKVQLKDGKVVECRPVFDLLQEYVLANFDPKSVSQMTWAPVEGIRTIARLIAANPEKTLFGVGMGPNQFFNNDLKDRDIFLLAALTRNVGFIGGNVGSYAGNYRAANFNGIGQWTMEDPFAPELDPKKPAKVNKKLKAESAHYWNYGDRPLRKGKAMITGKTHMPTPTKVVWVSNGNSLIGNAKGHYELVANTLPKQDMVVVSDWWWTASCEHADIVLAVDSWAELKHTDATISVTNPFLYMFPRTPLARIHQTEADMETGAGVGKALARLTGDDRFAQLWKFVDEGRSDVYLQRIFDASNMMAGLDVLDVEAKAKRGVPTLMQSRTYPKYVGYEQAYEDRPWYTKTGRLEFYRDEPEFRDSGENLPVFREPVDATFYEPNVIVAKPHVAIKPKSPEDYGSATGDQRVEERQARHVVKPWAEVARSVHPLKAKDPSFRFIFHSPKYRHGTHTTPVDTDIVAVWFGPFGDMMRHDKRSPYITEGYVEVNPEDARELGVADGDYVWVDADPEDRPFRGWEGRPEEMKYSRLLCRLRYYPGTPRGITRMFYNMYGATPGSVRGAETHAEGLARNPLTGYQSMFRSGSHQSATRAWLKPTLMTDTMVRKDTAGQSIGQGFEPDVHCTVGAPRESFVRITKAEAGGLDGKGTWRPVNAGLTPGNENAAMKRYLAGAFTKTK
ncbi:MAG: molybdopterin-dependent oxidoreductase [Myxococcota bacterium]